MGLTFIDGKVKGEDGKEIDVKFLVDSGVTYTLLAEDYWKAIKLCTQKDNEFYSCRWD